MATITALAPIAKGRNLLADPRLDTLSLNPRGATVTDTRPTTGAPDGGSYFRRLMVTANTSSPQNGAVTPSGTAGVPISPGQPITASVYRRKTSGGPGFRFDCQWFNAAGSSLSTSNGATPAVSTAWARQVETFTAPASAAFCSLGLTWTGIAVVAQTLDLAMAQFEYGAAATDFTDNQTINPLLVLNYGYARGSQNVVHDLLAGSYPAVSLRPAQSMSGTLSLLFGDRASARGAEDTLTDVNRFHFEEPAVGEDFHFIVNGPVNVRNETGTTVWVVDVGYREVAPA